MLKLTKSFYELTLLETSPELYLVCSLDIMIMHAPNALLTFRNHQAASEGDSLH